MHNRHKLGFQLYVDIHIISSNQLYDKSKDNWETNSSLNFSAALKNVIRRSLISCDNTSPDYPQVYEKQREVMRDTYNNKVSLINNIDKITNNNANDLLNSLQVRSEPYMQLYPTI